MDIREILAALDEEDRKLWSQCRTEMRRTYLNAHNQVLGVTKWEAIDDCFMDLIDIRLAVLFDRAGRISTNKEIIDNSEKIEEKIIEEGSKIFKNGNEELESNYKKMDEWK